MSLVFQNFDFFKYPKNGFRGVFGQSKYIIFKSFFILVQFRTQREKGKTLASLGPIMKKKPFCMKIISLSQSGNIEARLLYSSGNSP